MKTVYERSFAQILPQIPKQAVIKKQESPKSGCKVFFEDFLKGFPHRKVGFQCKTITALSIHSAGKRFDIGLIQSSVDNYSLNLQVPNRCHGNGSASKIHNMTLKLIQ